MEHDDYCQNCEIDLNEDNQNIVELDVDGEIYAFCSDECADYWVNSDKCYPEYEREYYNPDDPMFEDMNYMDFRDPGGGSALRNGPRIHPCPNCGRPDMLSPKDVQLGYQCDSCADQAERGW
jgi:hypothetical protein